MFLDLDEAHEEHSASFQRLSQNWFRQSSHTCAFNMCVITMLASGKAGFTLALVLKPDLDKLV